MGGRVHTLRVWDQGLHAEGGGESIDDNHHAMQALVARFGLRTEKRPANKILDGATFWRGRRYRTADFVAGAGGAVGAEYSAFYDAIAKATAGVDPAHPDQATHAAALDRQSLASFIDAQHLRPEARFLVETDYRSEYNSDPAHVSMLFIAQQTNVSAGVPDSAVETMRIHGGNDQLPRAMAASLGSRVVLGAPVTRIEQRADGATVHDGLAHRGGCVGGGGVPHAAAAAGDVQPRAARVGGRAGGRPRPREGGQGGRRVPRAVLGEGAPERVHRHRPALRGGVVADRLLHGRRRACSTPSSPGPRP